MRWALALLLAACAAGEPEGRDGSAGDASAAAPDAAVAPEVPDSRLLYFEHGDDAWLASAAGTEAREICDAATLEVSLLGGRALCVPRDPAAPLRLFDLDLQRVLQEYPGWRAGLLGVPALSPDGSKVAFVGSNLDGLDIVRVFDDGGNMVAEIRAFGVLAFPGDDVLVLDIGDGPPGVWRIGDAAPRRPEGVNAQPVGPDPAGVVFEVLAPAFAVRFLGGDGAEADLGPGTLGATFGSRVLVLSLDGTTAHLRDLRDPAFDRVVELPAVPFDRVRGTRLVGPDTVVFEERVSVQCGADARVMATRSTWRHLDAGEPVELASGNHRVATDRRAAAALVLDLDACGLPAGTGHVVALADGERRPLTDFLPDPVRAGEVSPDGRFVALALDGGVRVLDRATDTVRVASSGAPGGAAFHFR